MNRGVAEVAEIAEPKFIAHPPRPLRLRGSMVLALSFSVTSVPLWFSFFALGVYRPSPQWRRAR